MSASYMETNYPVENLSPQDSTVPLGQNGTFLCVSMEDLIVWQVTPPGNGTESRNFVTFPPRNDESLVQIEALNFTYITGLFKRLTTADQGLFISQLIIEGTGTNNLTKVKCTSDASFSASTFANLPSATLKVFGNLQPSNFRCI